MKQLHNFSEANHILNQYVPDLTIHEAYTLDRIKNLMNYLGNPQDKLKILHVAGTSGKTSTSYYAAALLQSTGYKVGLTVSPHLIEINDRVQINMTPLPESDFCAELNEFLSIVDGHKITPSYFELMIAFAFWVFARKQVDYAVIEVGLGGLLDATNTITRSDKVCLITDIGFDHTHILGTTLGAIAYQKAGIIQPHNRVFCYEQNSEVDQAISKQAKIQSATLEIVPEFPIQKHLLVLPSFQQRNAHLAAAAADYVLWRDKKVHLRTTDFEHAATKTVPGRMEIFSYNGKTIVLDGAHNAQKLQTFTASIKDRFGKQPAAAMIALVRRREYQLEGLIEAIAPLADNFILTAFQTPKDYFHESVNPLIIQKLCTKKHIAKTEIITPSEQALSNLLARPEKLLIVTGSFYLISQIRPRILELMK